MGQSHDDRHQDLLRQRGYRRHQNSRPDQATGDYDDYPICVAKTQYSFSTDPQLRGAPSNHEINIREVRLAAGAQFVAQVCGDVMTMPGLPKGVVGKQDRPR